MRIISHRGYWLDPGERNTRVAFERSFSLGFGTETDIRDMGRDIVISHDSPSGGELLIGGLLELAAKYSPALLLALNVKSDGLQGRTAAALRQYALQEFFVFDMSVPDSLNWIRQGIPVFMRQSEYEPAPALYSQAAGIWLDAFTSDWWTVETISRHLDAGKGVCIVSPELHARDHRPAWERLLQSDIRRHPDLILCTDLPEAARDFLNDKD